MTKLQYLIRTSYFVRPELDSDAYQANISKIITGIITEYLEYLRNGEIPKETIILNLKEIIYADLTFAFDKRTKKEKDNLITAYLFVVNQAHDVIMYTLSSKGVNPQTVLNQINNYISYTQFWETINWGNYNKEIENIVHIHRSKIISIAYRIIFYIITYRLDSVLYFKVAKQIIDLFGLLDVNEFSGNWYEELIEPSGFHTIRFDDSYFTTIFLYAVYLSEGEQGFIRHFDKLIRESKKGTKSSICRSLINRINDIKEEEIQVLSLSTYEDIINKKDLLIRLITDKVESFEELERATVFDMKISDQKFDDYKKDMLANIYYEDLESKISVTDNITTASYYTYIPKLAMVDQNSTIFVGGFRNEELIGFVIYNEIKDIQDKQEKILNLKDIDPAYNKLLLPREYYMDIVEEFDYSYFPESKDVFYNEIEINKAPFYYHWINNSDCIYAISSKDSDFLIDYKNIDISIYDTVKSDNNEAILRIKIDIPYYISEQFKLKKYSIHRIKKDV